MVSLAMFVASVFVFFCCHTEYKDIVLACAEKLGTPLQDQKKITHNLQHIAFTTKKNGILQYSSKKLLAIVAKTLCKFWAPCTHHWVPLDGWGKVAHFDSSLLCRLQDGMGFSIFLFPPCCASPGTARVM